MAKKHKWVPWWHRDDKALYKGFKLKPGLEAEKFIREIRNNADRWDELSKYGDRFKKKEGD